MPVVKIDLKEGKSKDFKRIFMDSVHESIEVLPFFPTTRSIN